MTTAPAPRSPDPSGAHPTEGAAGDGVRPGEADALPPQQLRLAMTFTGGVSLAVWMGGVAREVNLLVQASHQRTARGESPAAGRRPHTDAARDLYARLLGLLGTQVSVDVLCGTSAGGINAALLGLANARGTDLGPLREVWLAEGALVDLLRDPDVARPLSLLQGDGVLLRGLDDALRPDGALAGGDGLAGQAGDPTTVLITTTLLRGEDSNYADDFGTLVRDTDHHGLFTFTPDQLGRGDATTLAALALAARCSASFPAAFEPALVPIGAAADAQHPDLSSYANTTVSQFAADGGLLANFPLGPTLQAIADRPIDSALEVRRVLAYVVPSAGEQSSTAAVPPASVAETPELVPALLADLSATRSQSITAALADLRRHNDDVRATGDRRRYLARIAGPTGLDPSGLYGDFRQRQATTLAVPIARELARGLPAAGTPNGPSAGQEFEQLLRAATAVALRRLPATFGDLPALGWPALRHAYGTVRELLRTALVLPHPDVTERAATRTALAGAMSKASAVLASGPPPTTPRDAATGPDGRPLDGDAAVGRWLDSQLCATTDLPRLGESWAVLAGLVETNRSLLETLAAAYPAPAGDAAQPLDRRQAAAANLRDLLDFLAGTGPALEPRLAALYVADRVMSPGQPVVEQPVELVQMSADTRTLLDSARQAAAQKLTGLQMFHFGAFYKRSWRANDWMWGRLDGCGWLVHVLLDPKRLRALADVVGNGYRESLLRGLRELAGEEPAELAPAITSELGFLADHDAALPTSLPATALWVASAIQRHIAGEELAGLADEVGADAGESRHLAGQRAFLDAYHAAPKTGGAPSSSGGSAFPAVAPAAAAGVLRACQVSAETISDDMGSTRFVRTTTKAAAVVGRLLEGGKRLPTSLRAVTTTFATVTRVAYQGMRFDGLAQLPWLTGMVVIVLGLLAATSTFGWLATGGAVAALVGALLVGVGMGHDAWRFLARMLLVVAGALLALAGWMTGAVHDRLFGWLSVTALPYLESHAAVWALVVAFLLLPALVAVIRLVDDAIRRTALKRRQRAAGQPPAPLPAGAIPAPAEPVEGRVEAPSGR